MESSFCTKKVFVTLVLAFSSSVGIHESQQVPVRSSRVHCIYHPDITGTYHSLKTTKDDTSSTLGFLIISSLGTENSYRAKNLMTGSISLTKEKGSWIRSGLESLCDKQNMDSLPREVPLPWVEFISGFQERRYLRNSIF